MALGKVSMYLPVLAGLLGNWSLFYDASSWGHDWFNCNWFGHAGSALKSICYTLSNGQLYQRSKCNTWINESLKQVGQVF